MGKIKNIVAGCLAVLWCTIPWQASNNLKIDSQRETTAQEIVNVFNENQNNLITINVNQNPEKYSWIYEGFETNPESLDREKIYDIDLSEIPTEILKYGMLRKMNEIRKAKWLKPLKYDEKLEQVAQDFANDERDYERWNNPYPHADSKWRWVKQRLEEAWLLDNYIEIVVVDYKKMWYWENMWSISWHTINTLYEDRMNSPGHKIQIISKYHNSVWFGISTKSNVIVHEFWNVKK